ncbi:MAG: MBL fold metallo-hydrolase [Candidatus Hydrogenedentes bacterium]|nr:MBL fold metallo-hydrolase [Candidatus Hydrogenedentota bacterium]
MMPVLSRAVMGMALAMAFAVGTPPAQAQDEAAASFVLWQLPNQTSTQMMSYVIRTVRGKVIVIDGGNEGDAPYLREFVAGLGNTVAAWFVTHPHSDHVDALGVILRDPKGMEIGPIYGSMPDEAWMAAHASEAEQDTWQRFHKALAQAGREVTELELGQELAIDGLRIEILGVKNPEITANPVNNQSLVMRVSDKAKSVLFTADLGVEGGEKLLASAYAERLHADYCQMAHHGQNGVSEAFYQKVNPSYCLWPAPKWLYENDNGGGKGSGPWRTLEVRAWMDKLPIQAHFPMCEGLKEIR